MTLTLNMIKHRISDLEHEDIPNDIKYQLIQKAKIDVLYWAIQGGNVKTTDQIKIKIKRFNEELIGLNKNITDGDNLPYLMKTSSIDELSKII